MVKIYLIRHGETDFNVEHKIAGQIETNLTERGKKQALELAYELKKKNITFDALLCSPLKRAHDTANIISEVISVPIIYNADLKEFSNGIYEGVKIEDLKQLQFTPPYKTAGCAFSNGADLWDAYSSFDPKYDTLSYPEGETKQQACDRFMNAIKTFLDKMPNVQNLGVVAHGAVIRFMLLKICPHCLKEKIKNTEVRTVLYDSNKRVFEASPQSNN